MTTTNDMRIYEVGGCVRDELGQACGLDWQSKDVDYTVIGCSSFEEMIERLQVEKGFPEPFTTKEETYTATFKVPDSMPELLERTRVADFVWGRIDGPYTDGRHPDWVKPATTLEDDQRRRDFTVNSMAKDPSTGQIFDPFGGGWDITNRTLRFVGDPGDRINEDGLRVLRGLRFMVTKGLRPTEGTKAALRSQLAAECMTRPAVKKERIFEELVKMFNFDYRASLELLANLPPWTKDAIFRDGVSLAPSLKGRKR